MPDRPPLTERPRTGPVAACTLEPAERAAATVLARRLAAGFPAGHGPAYLRAAALASHELPPRLRAFLLDRRTLENHSAFVVSGFDVDDGAIGPTPAGWGRQADA